VIPVDIGYYGGHNWIWALISSIAFLLIMIFTNVRIYAHYEHAGVDMQNIEYHSKELIELIEIDIKTLSHEDADRLGIRMHTPIICTPESVNIIVERLNISIQTRIEEMSNDINRIAYKYKNIKW
jgi:hypothetical protein